MTRRMLGWLSVATFAAGSVFAIADVFRWWVFALLAGGAAAGGALIVLSMGGWAPPARDPDAKAAEARLWSIWRSSGGGAGG